MIIYSIKNIKNGNEYIGQTTVCPYKHWSTYKYKLKNNKFHNQYLQNSWNKYGLNSFIFEVVDSSAKTIDELNELEIEYIKERGKYNILIGGNNKSIENRKLIGIRTKLAMTKKVREKMANAMSGRIPWNRGLTYNTPCLRGDNNPSKRPDVKLKMSKNHADVSGQNNPNSKLEQKDIKKIIFLYKNSKLKGIDVAKFFNISRCHLLRILKKHQVSRNRRLK